MQQMQTAVRLAHPTGPALHTPHLPNLAQRIQAVRVISPLKISETLDKRRTGFTATYRTFTLIAIAMTSTLGG